jgi:hypothetical protein
VTSGNVTQTILVTLNLSSAPVGGDIKVQPTSLNFSYVTPQGTPPLDQEIIVKNVNVRSGSISLTISYTISSPSGGKCLTLTQGGNPIPNGGTKTTPAGIYAHVDPTGLSPGTYNATITIAPASGAAVNIPVTLSVVANPNPTTISVTPSTLTFTWQQGAMSADQYVQVTESGPQFAFVAQSDSPAWLSAYSPSVTPPATLEISASGMGLAPGTYTGTINITLPLLAGVSAKVTVSLTVLPAPSLIQEFGVTTTNSQPLSIATGPDGNLWFTESAASKIAKITPAGAVTEYSVAPNTVPSGITAGPDGNLWFTEMQTSKIGRITNLSLRADGSGGRCRKFAEHFRRFQNISLCSLLSCRLPAWPIRLIRTSDVP